MPTIFLKTLQNRYASLKPTAVAMSARVRFPFVKSKRVEGERWQVQVETEVEIRYNETKTAHVVSRIMDPLGNSVACLRSDPREMALRTSTSVHQLYLGVGDAMSDSMREFQIRMLKEMGATDFARPTARTGKPRTIIVTNTACL